MKKIYDTRIDVLNDTIAYYWGRGERQCSVNGNCQYIATDTSDGCAIGRLIEPEIADKMIQSSGVNNKRNFKLIPKWLKKLGKNFLIELQDAHDGNWLVNEDKEYVCKRFEKFVNTKKIIWP